MISPVACGEALQPGLAHGFNYKNGCYYYVNGTSMLPVEGKSLFPNARKAALKHESVISYWE